MCTSRMTGSPLLIAAICGFAFALQSLPSILQLIQQQKGNGPDSTFTSSTKKYYPVDQLHLPAIIICNRLPYSQVALNSLGDDLSGEDTVVEYLREWMDPSLSDSPDHLSLLGPQGAAEAIISKYLPPLSLESRMQQLLLKCLDMISSCIYDGGKQVLSAYECCQRVEPFLSTLHGVCYVMRNNHSTPQSILNQAGLQITFQISRSQFISGAHTSHPGIDIFLQPPDWDRLRMAMELNHPLHLQDKRSLQAIIAKERLFSLTRPECGSNTDDSLAVDRAADKFMAHAYAKCILNASIEECGCVPLGTVLWTLQGDLESSFIKQFKNVSAICTVGTYNACARQYINFLRPIQWQYNVPDNTHPRLRRAVERCRTTHIPCHRTIYNSYSYESDLPPEYKNTNDFVARLSLSFERLMVADVIEKYVDAANDDDAADALQLLTIIGYNFATWFAVGHVVWSLLNLICPCAAAASSSARKIAPKEQMVPVQIGNPIQAIPTTATHNISLD